MINLFLISGFNPFNLNEWRIDQYYKNAYSPRKNNWTLADIDYALDWYTCKYGDDKYILSCHSDGGTIAHTIAHTDDRCLGLHCHSALYTKEKSVRNIPILFTNSRYDLTGMGLVTNRAYKYYNKIMPNGNVEKKVLKRTDMLGHAYEPSVPMFADWCKRRFNLSIDVATKNL